MIEYFVPEGVESGLAKRLAAQQQKTEDVIIHYHSHTEECLDWVKSQSPHEVRYKGGI